MSPRITRRFVSTTVVVLLLAGLTAPADATGDESSGAAQASGPIPGARQVFTNDASGRLEAFTSIPDGSRFSTEGGPGKPCLGFVDVADPAGGIRADVQESMNWIFLEGKTQLSSVPFPIFGTTDKTPGVVPPVEGRGQLANASRTFTVFCQSTEARNFRGTIQVGGVDPALDPRPRITNLWNRVRLERPVIVPDPTVTTFGRFVTRHPSWLAVSPSSWGMRTSEIEYWRGWQLQLILRPVSLEFIGEQQPPPNMTPGSDAGVRPPFPVNVACVNSLVPSVMGADRFPQRPASMPNFAEPSTSPLACSWIPEFLGTVSLRARVTYEVTFWMSGYTERLADYVWDSTTLDFPVGGLSVVNVNGG